MVRKGVLEQQIEALAAVLANLLGLQRNGDLDKALLALHAACKELSGLGIDTVVSVSDETLLSLLATNGDRDAGKCLVVAALLGEQARIQEKQGQAQAARAGNQRAFLLLTEALIHEDTLRNAENEAHLLDLTARLSAASDLPLSLLHRLFHCYEALGRFGKAEDALFALRERGYSGAREEAASFYRRLLSLSDAALAAGGLPRDEVEEGLTEVAARTA